MFYLALKNPTKFLNTLYRDYTDVDIIICQVGPHKTPCEFLLEISVATKRPPADRAVSRDSPLIKIINYYQIFDSSANVMNARTFTLQFVKEFRVGFAVFFSFRTGSGLLALPASFSLKRLRHGVGDVLKKITEFANEQTSYILEMSEVDMDQIK